MSRFFHGGSDSESSSDEEELYERDAAVTAEDEEESSSSGSSESESSDEESSEEGSDEETEEKEGKGFLKFLRGETADEESEDEERVTVVKSAKDKRLEELEGTMRLIENAQKINDWVVISTGTFYLLFPIQQCLFFPLFGGKLTANVV
jgi:translation initiation factor 3 subunit C